jgi:hypothetical protein
MIMDYCENRDRNRERVWAPRRSSSASAAKMCSIEYPRVALTKSAMLAKRERRAIAMLSRSSHSSR